MKIIPVFILTLAIFAPPSQAKENMRRNYFSKQKDGSSVYHATNWTLTVKPNRGWTSLKVNEQEFLHSSPTVGGAIFQVNSAWITQFPADSLISNSAPTQGPGTQLSIDNGIFMLRLIPDPIQNILELYAGGNQEKPFRLVLLLSDDIAFIRKGEPIPGDRSKQPFLGAAVKKVNAAVIVHKGGPSLHILSPCLVGKIKDPSGTERWAVQFDCNGFAANSFRIAIESEGLVANWVEAAFSVRSSEDPDKSSDIATKGVINPIYTPKTKLDYAIALTWLKKQPFSGHAELEIIHALGKPHYFEEKSLTAVVPDSQRRIRISFNPRFCMPGISDVWGRLFDADGNLIWMDRFRILYDRKNYRPDLQVQPDHREFWQNTLNELKKIPLSPTCERVEKYKDHPTQEIYDVTFNTWGNKRIHAMLFVPKKRTGPLPAIVSAHPGITGFRINKGPDGVYGTKEFEKDVDAVKIIPLIRGYAPDAADIPFNLPWWGDLSSQDTFCAREWYGSMVRAVDYLETRPDLVDMNKLVASGGSQGGALALVTAALDPRIKFCFSMCPAACQFHEMLENYRSFGPSSGQIPEKQTLEQLKTTLSYYDAVNFCPWIQCPTYIGFNVGDLTVHSMGPLAAFQNLTGLDDSHKDVFIGYSYMHGSGPGLKQKEAEILERLIHEK